MATQSAIIWPTRFLPGTTDNFVSNEIIVQNITSSQIWALLSNITQWPSYYHNCSNITPPTSGPFLHLHNTFSFSTFNLRPLPCTVEESVPPEANGAAGRLAWRARSEDGTLEVYHAWLVEDLEGQRVRVLTQESQVGGVFGEWAGKKPNVMLLGHQDWLDGLVRRARAEGRADPSPPEVL
ncbi:hypothetical protein T440DRAFT_535677 [Plenodomus tracheiphilus IPT5]|uniref:Polyketide cyclase/dehydrase n=1 Tax=Plenodomus tracheiphilus IPT5 TaxID=1408161 RepID=A0A6A7BLB4_9PLEO|nr:hypothetical protein T440DRAFT_535677 [Plenodomus tracheiphilus IPT5]